jgi:hypothetical protein
VAGCVRPAPNDADVLRKQRDLSAGPHARLAACRRAAQSLTYLVDALRGLMIVGGASVHGYGVDFAVLVAVFFVLLMIAVKLYPTLVE